MGIRIRQHDTGFSNTLNGMHEVFDDDWFDEIENEEAESMYEQFIYDFADWLDNNGVNISEYPNKPYDAEYYFGEYMKDPDADHTAINTVYKAVHDWIKSETEYAESEDYLVDRYSLENGEVGYDIAADEYDIQNNAEKVFRENEYTEKDLTHGFKSAADLVKAVNKCVDDRLVEDIEHYDAGSYGYHEADIDGEWFETGCLFLGNGEEEWQMQTSVPFSEENDYGGCYNYFTVHGDLIYTISDLLFVYGVKWEKVEEAGDELGLRNGTAVTPDEEEESNVIEEVEENNVIDEDDIPRF